MKIFIGDREYRAYAIPETPLWSLRELQRQHGIKPGELAERLAPIAKWSAELGAGGGELTPQQGTEFMMRLLDDEDVLEAFLLNIWLTRHANGEELTFEQSSRQTDLASIRYEREPGDAPVEAALPPVARAGSARAGARQPQDRQPKRPSRSATSSARSTRTSPSSDESPQA